MRMKKVKKLFLILVAPLFTLLVSSALSITHDFNWQGIIVFVAVITALEMMLAIRSPNKLIDSIVGWMFCGALAALIATKGLLGDYAPLFESMELAMFAFIVFFICIPNIAKSKKQEP